MSSQIIPTPIPMSPESTESTTSTADVTEQEIPTKLNLGEHNDHFDIDDSLTRAGKQWLEIRRNLVKIKQGQLDIIALEVEDDEYSISMSHYNPECENCDRKKHVHCNYRYGDNQPMISVSTCDIIGINDYTGEVEERSYGVCIDCADIACMCRPRKLAKERATRLKWKIKAHACDVEEANSYGQCWTSDEGTPDASADDLSDIDEEDTVWDRSFENACFRCNPSSFYPHGEFILKEYAD